jgi:subfamily B ATP-binding cassette protein MsbA
MTEQPVNSREIYLRLLGYVRPYWPIFAAGILAMVLLGLTEASIPAILKPLLDGTFVDQDPFYLTWAPLGIVALFFVRGLATIASGAAFATIATRLVFDLRQHMFQRLLSLPTGFYDQHASGTLISKLIYDVTQVTQAGTEVLTTLIKDSVTVIALLAYVFWLDWQLSLFTFLLGPAIAGVAILIGRRIRHLSRLLQGTFGDMTHVLEESTRGHKVVKIYGGQAYEAGRFETITQRVRHLQFKHRLAASISVPVVEFIGALVMAAVIYIGTGRTAEEQLTVGGFVSFFAALGLLFSPIKRLTKMNDPLQRGLAAAESIFELIDQLPEGDEGSHRVDRCKGELRFEDVIVRYPGSEANALGPVNLAIEPMTTTALVGVSGSGKTTLANLVPRIYEPTAGRVLLDGVDLQEWSLRNLREQIAYVSQDVVLFNDTVANNIAYGRPAKLDAIREAAIAAGAMEFIEAMPKGFDTLVGENGVRLSGGQRQRLAIARALLADVPVLILDEATSALDSQSEAHIQAALGRLHHTRTTLIIAHRLSTVKQADRILVFAEGRIIEQGSHDELIQRKDAYYRLVKAQAVYDG